MKTLQFIQPGTPIQEHSIALDNRNESFITPPRNEIHNEKIASYAQDPAGTIVAGIIGELGADHFLIQGLWVSNSVRGRGVGATLLRLLEDYAIEKNIPAIFLESPPFQLVDFYLKNGFEKTTPPKTTEDQNAPCSLEKKLLETLAS